MEANLPFEGPILSKLGPSALRMPRIWIRAGAASSGRLRSWRVLAANARHGLPQHDPEKWTSVFQPKDEGGLRLLNAADLELVESVDFTQPKISSVRLRMHWLIA